MVHYEVSEQLMQHFPNSKPPVLPPRQTSEKSRNNERHRNSWCSGKYVKLISSLVVLLVIIGIAIADCFSFHYFGINLSQECPTTYRLSNVTGHCYKLSCESEQAHLASIHSPTEEYFLYRIVNDTAAISDNEELWIGLVYFNRKWQWIDGSLSNYDNRVGNQSDAISNEKYWTVLPVNTNSSFWRNVDNSKSRFYVCKMFSRTTKREWEEQTIRQGLSPVTTSRRMYTTTTPAAGRK